jgi:hypothetical protein
VAKFLISAVVEIAELPHDLTALSLAVRNAMAEATGIHPGNISVNDHPAVHPLDATSPNDSVREIAQRLVDDYQNIGSGSAPDHIQTLALALESAEAGVQKALVNRILEPFASSANTEAMAEAAHDAWLAEKRRRGVTSWPNEHGVEQMVPYAELDEDVREFDRVVVRAIAEVLDAR